MATTMPKPSSPWTPLNTLDEAQNAFKRPLGSTELGFYWDHVFNGTATTLQNIHVEAAAGCEGLLSEQAAEKAWIRLKRTFPLLGAQLDEHSDLLGVDFVVREECLSTVQHGELHFESVGSKDEVQGIVEQLVNGPTSLTNDKISELWVLHRKDAPRHFHLLLVVAHVITDGMAAATLMRNLCQELSSSSNEPIPTLRERLQVVPALEDLYPSNFISTPRRRWRKAIARVIYDIRNSKIQGGHTLPRKTTSSNVPAISRSDLLEFPVSTSLDIIATCRRLGITFGNALPVLSQIAHARILHHLRYKAGAISDVDWDFRTRQPMHFAGPLNLRPYLDEDWFKNKGGAGEVCLAINFYNFVLPSLPRSSLPPEKWKGEFPPYDSLLSQKRFLLRSRMIRQQTIAVMKHPLFVDITACRTPARVVRARNFGVEWRAFQKGEAAELNSTNNTNVAGDVPFVFSNGGASLGNRDSLIPYSFPVAKETPAETKLTIIAIESSLRCRPTELYLGASMSRQRLSFFLYWDSNVYSDDLVREWATEVQSAALHYLGQCPQAEEPTIKMNNPSKSRL